MMAAIEEEKPLSASSLSSYHDLMRRLAYLEQWRELAIRPSMDDAFPEDHDLLGGRSRGDGSEEEEEEEEEEEDVVDDDLPELTRRCLDVRRRANALLPLPPKGPHDAFLEVRTSHIAGAGLGLFVGTQRGRWTAGEIVCYYYGHIHTYQSAAAILTDRSYLLHVHGNVLLDAGPIVSVKARYINDPCNEDMVNVQFVPEPQELLRVAVVAIKTIYSGQELFVDYGEAYWSQQPTLGRPYYG
jgi:hypothetical protein